jgi:hypothetical protein
MTSYSRFLATLAAVAAVTAVTACAACASRGSRSGTGTAAKADGVNEAAQFVRLLENPDKRDAAACRLFELGMYRSKPPYKEDPCKQVPGAVNHVIVAPQDNQSQSPMYVVFRHWPFDSDTIGPGKSKGPVTLFDGDGYIVPYFHNANMLDKDDDVFAYAGDGRLAIRQIIVQSGDRDENDKEWNAQVLHVVPVTPRQQSVLSVIVGPAIHGDMKETCKGFSWGWRQRDVDADGVPEIEIGPWLDAGTDGNISPRAVYRWSKQTGRYDGPSGSIAEGFQRVDDEIKVQTCCAFFKPIERFALGQLRLAAPADPSAIRRNRCESFSITGASIP